MWPNRDVLKQYGYDVIDKKRACVILARDPEKIDENSCLFQDNLDFYYYCIERKETKYPSFFSERFSLSFIIEKCREIKGSGSITSLVLFGVVLLKILFESGDYPEYLMITELESEKNTVNYEVGELDYDDANRLYELVFTSESFRNEHGIWRFAIYKSKKLV